MLKSIFNTIYDRSQFKRDSVIIMIVLILPLLIYIHNLVPNVKVYETNYFTFDSKYYESIQVMFWILSIKIVLVVSYAVWYLTCKHWWRYALLVPFVFFCAQTFSVLNNDLYAVDKPDLIYGLFISIPFLGLLLILSFKLNRYSLAKKFNDQLDEEIEDLFEKMSNFQGNKINRIRQKYKELNEVKSKMTNKQYLIKLIDLRQDLI